MNVTTRIDDMLYIACKYVVIRAETEAEALRIVTTDSHYTEMRKKHATAHIED